MSFPESCSSYGFLSETFGYGLLFKIRAIVVSPCLLVCNRLIEVSAFEHLVHF